MHRSFIVLVITACATRQSAPAPAARGTPAFEPPVPAAESADETQDEAAYVAPAAADWTPTPPAFVLPTAPVASTSYATISGILIVDGAGKITRGDANTPLPDEIDPATLNPPANAPPPPAPGAKPLPRITGVGTLGVAGAEVKLPERTMPDNLGGVTADWSDNTILRATIVFGHRDAAAQTIYEAVRAGFNAGTTALAVTTDAGVRALRLTFGTFGSFTIDRAYLHVTLGATDATVAAVVGDKPSPKVFKRTASDVAGLVAAYEAARSLPQLGKDVTVWIQLADGVAYARLVEVLIALTQADARFISLSREPPISVPYGGLTSKIRIGEIKTAVTDYLPRVRRYLKRNLNKIQYCYEKELLAKPSLAGTVTLTFSVTPNGNVHAITSAGVDSEVAACVAAVVRRIEFPKPGRDGGVDVTTSVEFTPAK